MKNPENLIDCYNKPDNKAIFPLYHVSRHIATASLYAILVSGCMSENKKDPEVNKDTLHTTIPVKLIAPKIIPKDTIDFEKCKSYEDITKVLDTKNYIVTIDAIKYFEQDSLFFAQANITQEQFLTAYENSEIVKYGVYTDKYMHYPRNKSIDKLNNIIVDQSMYTQYINHSSRIFPRNLDFILQQVSDELYPTSKPKDNKISQDSQPLPIYKDMSESQEPSDNSKYGRKEAYDILQQHNIRLRSSTMKTKETGNNLWPTRTCIHNIKKKTINFLVLLDELLQKEFSQESIEINQPLVVTWWTENGHAPSFYHPNDQDHKWWAKIDISVYWKRGVLIWMLLQKYGIVSFQDNKQLTPISLKIWEYNIDIIPHDIHFDILVK